jgi:hypothetical protein
MEEKSVEIVIPEVNERSVRIKVIGTTSLLMDRFTDEALMGLIEKDQKKDVKIKKKPRDIQKEFEDSVHYLEGKKVGFPVTGFIKGAIRAAKGIEGMTMKDTVGLFTIKAYPSATTRGLMLVPIETPPPQRSIIRGNNPKSGALALIRSEFWPWSAELEITFDPDEVSITQIMVLVNRAGVKCGIGSWRPSSPKSPGTHGMYRVARAEDVKN